MKEAIEEHRTTPLRFSMVEDPLSRPPKRGRRGIQKSCDAESTHFAIPSVLIPSGKKRNAKRNERRCCTMPCCLRLLILLWIYPITYYYKEIKGIISLAPAHTKMSAPSIKRDYSSVKGVYDLSSEIINPWCFVSAQ
jgi:hypothetical protein